MLDVFFSSCAHLGHRKDVHQRGAHCHGLEGASQSDKADTLHPDHFLPEQDRHRGGGDWISGGVQRLIELFERADADVLVLAGKGAPALQIQAAKGVQPASPAVNLGDEVCAEVNLVRAPTAIGVWGLVPWLASGGTRSVSCQSAREILWRSAQCC